MAASPSTSSSAEAADGEGKGAAAVLIDTFGRVATDVRVPLTDRCDRPDARPRLCHAPLLRHLRPHPSHRGRPMRTCLFAREEPDLRGTPPGRRTRRSRRGGSARGFPDRPSAVPVIRGVRPHPGSGTHSDPGVAGRASTGGPGLFLQDTKWPGTERRPVSPPRQPNLASLPGPSPILAWGEIGRASCRERV